MDWLNINRQMMDSREFVGAEPTDRATWLCLLWHCVGQENGGRLRNCREWSDRSWQQLAGITLDEVNRPSALWTWDGADLVVTFYPSDREAALAAKREAGRAAALRRWHQMAEKAPTTDPLAAEPDPNGLPNGLPIADPIRNGREGKGKERNSRSECTRARPEPSLPTEPPPGMPRTEDEAREVAKVQGLDPDHAAALWNELAARDWTDRTGQPARNFARLLKSAALYRQDRNTREDLRRSRSPLPGRPTTNRNTGTFNDDPAIHAAIDAAVTR